MIQIYADRNGPGTSPTLDQMHRDRKRVFVDLLKWDVPVIDGQFEVDQFDTPAAVYLVATDNGGDHLGSIRLLPTMKPHLLGTIFPYLCEGPIPTGDHIHEISRGCLSPRLSAARRLVIRNRLTTAAVEYALLQGITTYSCIADSAWYSQILALGWNCMPLGLPVRMDGSLTGAIEIAINANTPWQLREAGTYAAAPLVPAPRIEECAA